MKKPSLNHFILFTLFLTLFFPIISYGAATLWTENFESPTWKDNWPTVSPGATVSTPLYGSNHVLRIVDDSNTSSSFWLSRNITLPANATSATISFKLKVISFESSYKHGPHIWISDPLNASDPWNRPFVTFETNQYTNYKWGKGVSRCNNGSSYTITNFTFTLEQWYDFKITADLGTNGKVYLHAKKSTETNYTTYGPFDRDLCSSGKFTTLMIGTGMSTGATAITEWDDISVEHEGGNSINDVNITAMNLEKTHLNNEYNKYIYQRGVDIVNIKAEVDSAIAGTYEVSASLIDVLNNKIYLGTRYVQLSGTMCAEIQFDWAIPPNATIFEYSIELKTSSATTLFKDAFFVSNLTNAQLSAPKSKCFSADQSCALDVAGIIPYAGIPANWNSLGDQWCNFIERGKNNKDPVGVVVAGVLLINEAAEVVHDTIGAITGVGEVTSAAHSAIGAAVNCLDAYAYSYATVDCGPNGYSCMIKNIFDKMGESGNLITSTMVVTYPSNASRLLNSKSLNAPSYNPPARIRISESNGDYVEYNSSGQIDINGAGMVYKIGPDAQLVIMKNSDAGRKIEIFGLQNSNINIEIINFTNHGITSHAYYNNIGITNSSIAKINLSAIDLTGDIKLDKDGDGTTDSTIKPNDISISAKLFLPLVIK